MKDPINVDFDREIGKFVIDASQTKGFTNNAMYRITTVVSANVLEGINGVAQELKTQSFVFVRADGS